MRTNDRRLGRRLLGLPVLMAASTVLVAGVMDPWDSPAPTMKPVDLVEPRTPLFDEMFPVTIATPGSYLLMGNVLASGGITIRANDVTVDLNGFTLEGTGAGPGIATPSPQTGITLRNGTVRNWGGHGIDLGLSSAVSVRGVMSTDNGESGIVTGDRSLIADCRSADNGDGGILVGFDSVILRSIVSGNGAMNPEPGIASSGRLVVRLTTVHQNNGPGMSVGTGSLVVGCTASANQGHGIFGEERTRIADSAAEGNLATGLVTGSDGVIEGSTAQWNDVGISAGAGAIVRDCSASSNDGGIVISDGGLVEASSASSNTSYGIDAGHGAIVRDCVAVENDGDGIRATYGVDVVGNICWRNGHYAGDAAGIYVEGVDNRIDGNHVMFNDRGIETALGGNTIVRNSARGNDSDYGTIASGNDVGPIGPAQTATSPWANIQF